MLIVGGSGNNRGALLGAVAGLGAVERAPAPLIAALFPPDQQARAAALQIALIGIVLAAILLLRPRGLIGERRTVSRFVE